MNLNRIIGSPPPSAAEPACSFTNNTPCEPSSSGSRTYEYIENEISRANSLISTSETEDLKPGCSYTESSISSSQRRKKSVAIDLNFGDTEHDWNHFVRSDYFRSESEELFNPYDLILRLNYPIKTRANQRLEKFKNYWENYSFYAVWRKKFIQDHSCSENEIWKEFFIASIPHLLINLFLAFYVLGGAFIFQLIDGNIQKEKFYNVVQFTFTTIATVGYGNIVPTADTSKLFCILYTLVGVPLLFLSLTNIGQFLAEGYWIFLASISRKQVPDVGADERRLPIGVVVVLLLTHSVIGGLLFHFWIDQMPVIPAIYFSFVSITTIGYGDITPTPNGNFQTVIIICYLAIGMVIMSTFVAALYNYLRRLHYLGRDFSGAADVEVWFGGTRMSVSELLHIIAQQFEISPKMLCDVLQDLDHIITAATDPRTKASIELDESGQPRSITKSDKISFDEDILGARRSRTVTLELKKSNNPRETHNSDNCELSVVLCAYQDINGNCFKIECMHLRSCIGYGGSFADAKLISEKLFFGLTTISFKAILSAIPYYLYACLEIETKLLYFHYQRFDVTTLSLRSHAGVIKTRIFDLSRLFSRSQFKMKVLEGL